MTNNTIPEPARQAGLVDRWLRGRVEQSLRALRAGRVTVIDGRERIECGDEASDLQATITVNHPRFYRRVAWGADLGAAESLMDGDWQCDDLTALVRILIRNLPVVSNRKSIVQRLQLALARVSQFFRRNTRRAASRNIRSPYDLSNEFFELFLDDTLSYSCGIFDTEAHTLREASISKIDRACQALDLRASDHLLEIGTGWGALAMHAAQHYGCRVTTTTISREQFARASQRVRDAGLQDRITVLDRDYRDLQGEFDKLVSIEMIEAVGHQYFDTFFRQCSHLLKRDGLMFLQGIVIADHCYETHIRSVDFINRYIFPGGCLPSVTALMQSVARSTDMRCLYLEDFAPHYAETLRHWRRAFLNRLDDVRALHFDDRFIRMWEYYLCYCEAVFEERRVNVVQMLLAKPNALRITTPCASVRSRSRQSLEGVETEDRTLASSATL